MSQAPVNDIPAPGTARRIIPPSKRGRIWVLEGARRGDNAQAHALAARLTPQYSTRRLVYNKLYRVPNIVLGARLTSLDRNASDDLHSPWPDLVISAGRRSVPVARWIRKQSGGKTRLVQIGRPRAPLDWFDLIITSPQYGLPAAANLVELPLPFTDPPGRAEEHADWQQQFTRLPRPWVGVLVGGTGWPYKLDEAAAHKLAAAASRLAHDTGGSLLVSTSPRTGRVQSKTIERALVVPAHVHHWTGPEDNPHKAILAFADRFLVTSDSISMIAEACATARPVELFDLPEVSWRLRWQAASGIMETLARHGVLSPPRDMSIVHRVLHERHLVTWHGETAAAPRKDASLADSHMAVVQLIRGWLNH